MNKDTACVHSGQRRDETRGLVTAIQLATAYAYLDADEPYYPRYFNTPNQAAVVAKLCALEGAEDGVLFGSGMAAISTTLMALLRPGDHAVLLEGLYGGTHSFVTEQFDRLGIGYTFAAGEAGQLARACTAATRVIYVESPTNPLLDVVELRAVAELAASRGAVSVIDNTFASPINQNPVRHGFDVVLHSGTKYLGGHSDLSSGVALADAAHAARIRATATQYGGALNALSCYLLERSLKTLSVRVERQNRNARHVADFLTGDGRVGAVRYPGLASHPGHTVAARQMESFGGMVAFELADGGTAEAFLRCLRTITPALSLGGVETTICAPAATSHRTMPEAERRRLGITGGLLRLSVGIEDAADLVADLDRALAA